MTTDTAISATTALTTAQHAQAIRTVGYTILPPETIGADRVARARARLAELLTDDEERFGRDFLLQVEEWGRTRLLANRGQVFLELLELPRVHELVAHVLGEYRVLYYNGTSLVPYQGRAQTGGGRWHVDLGLCTGSPLWLNVFYLLEDFTAENGATYVIPGSQQRPFPGRGDADLIAALEATKLQVLAPAGAVVVFDSTIWHAAGDNRTATPRLMIAAVMGARRGNAAYRPQFDHAAAISPQVQATLSPLVRRLLGLDDPPPPRSLEEYYARPESGIVYRPPEARPHQGLA
jgi:ectoine hydroxylase-related dioxygenase (phytanoyl-CoA dioxygenase family)